MAELHEQAEKDYIAGMKYQEIADKYNVSINTVKSWKKRHDWIRGNKKKENKKGCTQKTQKGCTQNRGVPVTENIVEIFEDTEHGLSEKQKLFCVYYVKTFNATRAYMKAYGCSSVSASANASRLLKDDRVKDYIQEIKQQKMLAAYLGKEDVIQKYAEIAFADVRDTVDLNENGTGLVVKEDFDGTMVDGIKETKYGIEVKMPNRLKALEKLERYFDMKELQDPESEENKRMGVIQLAPIIEMEEEKEDECIMESTAEAD